MYSDAIEKSDHVQANHRIGTMDIQAIRAHSIQDHLKMKLIIVDHYMYKHQAVQPIAVVIMASPIQPLQKPQRWQMNVLLLQWNELMNNPRRTIILLGYVLKNYCTAIALYIFMMISWHESNRFFTAPLRISAWNINKIISILHPITIVLEFVLMNVVSLVNEIAFSQ